MTLGRKRKCRNLEIDLKELDCTCFGPLQKEMELSDKGNTIRLHADEYQALIYQDRDNLTMDVACKKMGISKTVYAGIYKSARCKLITMILEQRILTICDHNIT